MVPTLLAANPAQYLFGLLLFVTATFLILLVLVQRGRGGGLAGAFGGMGGQSAFGTKAGDLFTKITIGVAAVWITLCVLTIVVLNRQTSGLLGDPGAPPPNLTAPGDETTGDEGTGDEATGDEGTGAEAPAGEGTGGGAAPAGGDAPPPSSEGSES